MHVLREGACPPCSRAILLLAGRDRGRGRIRFDDIRDAASSGARE